LEIFQYSINFSKPVQQKLLVSSSTNTFLHLGLLTQHFAAI